MDTDPQTAANWFLEQFALRLAEVLEAMAGARPEIRVTPGPAPAPEAVGPCWRQPFNGAPGAAWIRASQPDWTAAATLILHAAGLDDAGEPALKSTWTEILGQALSAVARDWSGRASREITCASLEESAEPGPADQPGPSAWARLTIQFRGQPAVSAEVSAALDQALSDSLASSAPETAAPATGLPAEPVDASANPKTFDLLLDVELPVSVSFGRAQVPLKDVIKLTTGAIVELNRSITEPVEVIVNNCVIARGEVVVVEGNFGVRIREVMSRQDRLRTLN